VGQFLDPFLDVQNQLQVLPLLLYSITSRIGLEKFGEAGTEFDPQIHDALMHETSADVSVPTASKILQSGYKFKERILRPASVAVIDPAGE
jgi:molecular chaperone GrpE